jgi:hypothetical protein
VFAGSFDITEPKIKMAYQTNEWMNDEDLKFQLDSLVKKAYQRSENEKCYEKRIPTVCMGLYKNS